MRLPEEFSFSCPLKINCGNRALAHLPVEMSAVDARAPLILANGDRIGKKRVKTVVDAFKASGMTLGIYDRLPDQPGSDLIPVLARMYRDGGCDCVIAVGGGSVVDTAKFLNLMVSSGDHGGLSRSGETMEDPGPLGPMMIVATSGGNGDEVTGYAGNGARRLCSPRLVPGVVFVDPSMMGDRNDRDVVDGALIGLVHAVEAFIDDSAGPMCRAYAHTAIGLIIENLLPALRKTDRRKSLCAVVNGQVAAGCAFFASSPGICHLLANRLKEQTGLPPGFLMATLLPHLVAETGTAMPEPVGELLYPMVGADLFSVTASELKIPRTVALFWEFFDAVNRELEQKIPSTLAGAGLTDEQIERVQSQMGGGQMEDKVARIVYRAKDGAAMVSE